MTLRWVRFNTDRAVFCYENSVPASVIPMNCTGTLYSCCANTLELRGGAVRAEGGWLDHLLKLTLGGPILYGN